MKIPVNRNSPPDTVCVANKYLKLVSGYPQQLDSEVLAELVGFIDRNSEHALVTNGFEVDEDGETTLEISAYRKLTEQEIADSAERHAEAARRSAQSLEANERATLARLLEKYGAPKT